MGVACVDMLIRDLIGDLTAFRNLDVAYTFMLDGTGEQIIIIQIMQQKRKWEVPKFILNPSILLFLFFLSFCWIEANFGSMLPSVSDDCP